MKVHAVKLITGEDLVSEVKENLGNPQEIILDFPISVGLMPSQTTPGQFGIGLAPFMPYLNDKGRVVVRKEHVIINQEVNEELRAEYAKQTGKSIIITPSKPKISLT